MSNTIASAVTSSVASAVAGRLTTFTPTITATAGSLYTLSVAATATPAGAAAQSILDKGAHAPNVYEPGNPLKLFIIQAVIIIAISRILAFGLVKLKQPKVISEVVGGIILGPSIMGRIPGFTKAIFPTASIPNLTLVANIGLVLFLFLVGLEADFSILRKNARAGLAISFIGLAVPFGMGAAVSVGVYNKFVDTSQVDFGIFLLFIGTAMAITAFPVLARILTELKLLQNPVGLTTLAAGVGNDVVGWILLALSVALANAGEGVTAVYIILTMVGTVLFLYFLVKPMFLWACRRSGSFETGPTPGILTLTFFIILMTAWITDIIGVHAIFGSFLVGLIVVPHSHGFGAAITEKMEDLVTILFIPIYFALSGLKTDLGLLNNGSIWGWVVCVCVVAFFSKFLSCFGAAKWGGFDMRESAAIGSLMACKGLVELIVLNIGLQAGILNNEVFAMFVVMALVTTFVTTPLTLFFYPESYRKEKEARLLAEKGGDGHDGEAEKLGNHARAQEGFRRRFVVVLERLESLPSMMSFVRLLGPSSSTSALSPSHAKEVSTGAAADGSDASSSEGRKSVDDTAAGTHKLEKHPSTATTAAAHSGPAVSSGSAISVDAFRLLALSDRTSALFRASEVEVTKKADSILNIFSAFANLASVRHSTSMSIVPTDEYAETVTSHVEARNADMVVIPWTAGTSLNPEDDGPMTGPNPLESVFGKQAIERSPQYAAFVRKVFLESHSDVGLFLDAGVSTPSPAATVGAHQHLFLPFHGGPDDRAALDFVMQLVSSGADMHATVVRFVQTAPEDGDDDDDAAKAPVASGSGQPTSPVLGNNQLTIGAGLGHQDTIYAGNQGTQHRLASDTADNIALAKYFPAGVLVADAPSAAPAAPAEGSDAPAGAVADVSSPLLPHIAARVTFRTVRTSTPLKATLDQLLALVTAHVGSASVLTVAGRSRRSAPSHRVELERYLKDKVATANNASGEAAVHTLGIAASSEVRKTLGDVGSALVVSGHAGSVLVFQSAVKGEGFLKSRKGKNV